MRRQPLLIIAVGVASAFATAGALWGFTFRLAPTDQTPVRWSDDVVMELQLGASPQLADGSSSYDDAFEWALADWNDALQDVDFAPVFYVRRNSTAPIGVKPDGYNNVFFSNAIGDKVFEDHAVAVTLVHATRNKDGYWELKETDVIFNNEYLWDSYRGRQRGRTLDLKRVALHEAGHVLGLDHPDQAKPPQRVVALMNSHEGNSDLDSLQSDDIAGAVALYSVDPPDSPANLTASASAQTITLNWTPPTSGDDPTGYVVYVGSRPGSVDRTLHTGITKTTFSAGGFSPGTYYVSVSAANWAGTSDPTEERAVTVHSGCTLPAMPTLTVISNAGGTIVLGWTVPSGNPTTYILYQSTETIRDDDLDSRVPGEDLHSSAATLTRNVNPGTYHFRIRAANACGKSPASTPEVIAVVVPRTPTPTPTPGETVYSGPFSGTYTQVGRFRQGTCTWTFTYRGSQTMRLTERADGTVTGSIHVTGTQNAGPGRSSSVNLTCNAPSFSVDYQTSVSGMVSNIRWTRGTWSFSGRRDGNAVTGTMTTSGNDGTYTNTGSFTVTLKK